MFIKIYILFPGICLMDKEQKARKNLLRKGADAEGEAIKGYDFNLGLDYRKIIENYGNVGFQASNFAKAVEITNEMIGENAFIFLGYTSNVISSGLRDVIRWLVEHKKVNVIVTTCGGVEEDVIKCFGDFVLGDFRASGSELRKKGINRIGNIFASNNLYVRFESFIQPILEELYDEQKKSGKITTASELIWRFGKKINDKRSICYWAFKNKINVYCPAIMDGAIGDNIYFFQFKHKDFKIDVVQDATWFNNATIGLKKSGVIILGAGIVKHAILNANMLRNGADYAVYINTEQEYDGSDSGALPEEAVSWGKIKGKSEGKSVKVFAEATLVFSLLVASTFASEK